MREAYRKLSHMLGTMLGNQQAPDPGRPRTGLEVNGKRQWVGSSVSEVGRGVLGSGVAGIQLWGGGMFVSTDFIS